MLTSLETIPNGSHDIMGDRHHKAGPLGKSGAGGGTSVAALGARVTVVPVLLSDAVGNSACG